VGLLDEFRVGDGSVGIRAIWSRHHWFAIEGKTLIGVCGLELLKIDEVLCYN